MYNYPSLCWRKRILPRMLHVQMYHKNIHYWQITTILRLFVRHVWQRLTKLSLTKSKILWDESILYQETCNENCIVWTITAWEWCGGNDVETAKYLPLPPLVIHFSSFLQDGRCFVEKITSTRLDVSWRNLMLANVDSCDPMVNWRKDLKHT